MQAAVKLRTDLLKQRTDGPNQQLCHQLLARIRRGKFLSGTLLPSENQLCKQHGVSVATARHTFVERAKEGGTQRRVSVGVLVAPRVRRTTRLTFVNFAYVGDLRPCLSSIMGGPGPPSFWPRRARLC